jgi:hypothetical protein
MREEFSTLDIVKALNIPRGRLRQWMDLGFIKPAYPSEMQGSKAIFTRYDVYGVGLFDDLLSKGFKRDMAGKIFREYAKPVNYETIKWIGIIFTGQTVFAINYRTKKELLTAIGNNVHKFEKFDIVNFTKLKKKVDEALSVLE